MLQIQSGETGIPQIAWDAGKLRQRTRYGRRVQAMLRMRLHVMYCYLQAERN